jgi:hypothetical protein
VRTITTNTPVAEDARLSIYPNPTNGKVTVQFESESETPTDITVMDMRGRIVVKRNNELGSKFSREIDLSHVENGFYILIISKNGEIIKSTKVSKIN